MSYLFVIEVLFKCLYVIASLVCLFYLELKFSNPLNHIQADVWFTQNSPGGSQGPLYFPNVIQLNNIWYTFGKPLGST